MYERFTDRARKVMQLANQEAQRFNHEYIGTEHILLGLISEGSGVAANVLKNLKVSVDQVRAKVEALVQPGPDMVTMGKLPQTPRAKKVVEYSIEEARLLDHNYVGTEHILLGLLREQEGVAAQVLAQVGLKLEDVRADCLNLLGFQERIVGAPQKKVFGDPNNNFFRVKVKTPFGNMVVLVAAVNDLRAVEMARERLGLWSEKMPVTVEELLADRSGVFCVYYENCL